MPIVSDPSSVTSALSEAIAVDMGRPAEVPPMPQRESQPLDQPPASPAPLPAFADIEDFATGAELTEATRDPARLSALLKERVDKLHEAYSGEREQAEHFRNLMGVPEMREHILSKLEGRNGNTQQPQAPRQVPQPSDEIAQLRREMQAMRSERQAETQGQRAVNEFRATHPDLDAVAPAMQRIMKDNPGTTLAVAYRLAKFEAGALKASQNSSPPPVSERPTAGVAPSSQNDVIAALGTKLRDRSRYKTMEDAWSQAVRDTGAFQE